MKRISLSRRPPKAHFHLHRYKIRISDKKRYTLSLLKNSSFFTKATTLSFRRSDGIQFRARTRTLINKSCVYFIFSEMFFSSGVYTVKCFSFPRRCANANLHDVVPSCEICLCNERDSFPRKGKARLAKNGGGSRERKIPGSRSDVNVSRIDPGVIEYPTTTFSLRDIRRFGINVSTKTHSITSGENSGKSTRARNAQVAAASNRKYLSCCWSSSQIRAQDCSPH